MRQYSRLQLVVLFTLLLLPCVLSAAVEKEHKKQLSLLRERMQQVEKSISAGEQSKTHEQQVLKKIDTQLGATAKTLRKLKRQLSQKKQHINKLKQQQGGLQQAIGEQKTLLAEQLRAAYMMGRQQRVKMLLNQQQPDRMSRVMRYYDYFNQARVDNVKVLDHDVQQLKLVEQQLKGEQTELARVIARQGQQNKRLIADKKQRKLLLARLAKQLTSSAQTLAELKANEKRLTNLLSSIQQAINDIPVSRQQNKSFRSQKGRLHWPVKGMLRKRFGSARKSGRYDGVVIAAREGASIRSISHGRVVYADWLRGYGLLIIVDHGADYLSLYAFNESLYKDVGDWVDAGESIAAVGLSGGQQKAGLYFSIRKKGKPVNPVRWCRAVRKGRVG